MKEEAVIPQQHEIISTAFPWRWAGMLYLVLFLAAFAFPDGLVDWLDDRNAGGWLSIPLTAAKGIDIASKTLGVKAVAVELRRRFSSVIGERDI